MARLMWNLWAIIPVAVTHNNMTDDERSREQCIKLNKDRMLNVAFWELSSAQLSYLDYNFAESVEDCFYAFLLTLRESRWEDV